MQPVFGFREITHIADCELEVWAPDLPTLLEQAARGMYALSGLRLQTGLTQSHSIAMHADDAESLLVRFLTELLWVEQKRGLGFEEFSIHVEHECDLRAELRGSKILSLEKEIKAVTYHNLAVQSTPAGLHVNIVFDV
jgi:protein archease